MTGFFWNARHHRQYPVAAIREIGPLVKDGQPWELGHHVVELTGDRNVYVDQLEVERITNGPLVMVRATPGYNLITTGAEDLEDWIRREPVIAWDTTAQGPMRPITINGPWDGFAEMRPIEKPDGRVTILEGFEFENVEEFAAHERERVRAARAAPTGKDSV